MAKVSGAGVRWTRMRKPRSSRRQKRPDAPERMRPSQGQRGAAERLAAIVNTLDDAIIGKTLDGIIISWNDGARKLFGYKATEIIGKPVSMLVPEDRRDEERSILERIARGERVPAFETSRSRKDGTQVHVSVSISPVHDASGAIVGASKIARD